MRRSDKEQKPTTSAILRENQKLRRELNRYRYLAYRDALTGLYNRRAFNERLKQECARAKRAQGRFCLLTLDINQFKTINDLHGHQAGDHALKLVAKSLKKSVRDHDLCFRTGGDEFCVLLVDADEASLQAIQDRIHRHLDSSELELGFKVSVSVGSACFPMNAASPRQLTQHADEAMYQDKASHRPKKQPKPLPSIALVLKLVAASLFVLCSFSGLN